MILVTGSTGLVGSHLIYDLLNEGYEVRALVRNSSNKSNILRTFQFYTPDAGELFNRIHWIEGDITDIISLEEAFDGISQVYHTAAFVSFNSYSKEKIFEVNVEGTANVVNFCMLKKVQKLCYVSSIAALGVTDDGSPINEDVFWKSGKNRSAYSVSKYRAEMEVWRGITEGLNAVIVNPSVILGPGNWNDGSASIIRFSSKGIPFYTNGLFDFVDVRDVTRAMTLLMNSNIAGERFLLSSGNISCKDFMGMVSNQFHKQSPKLYLPRQVLKLIWYLELVRAKLSFTTPRISKEAIDMFYQQFKYSAEKVKRRINMEFRPVKQTISDLCFLYRNAR